MLFDPFCVYSRFFPGGSDGEESACNEGDLGSIPGSAISPGEGNGNPLQYSCLKNPMDRGAWQATSMGSQRVGTLFQVQVLQSTKYVFLCIDLDTGGHFALYKT